ncbi:hypothetical protein N7532_004011 [Penicillium argentinense]|uniref:Uncharacterized protein n=1 Tax=Penicillium argentinense TaxID=1131581 RepID=A0A9W9FNK0_9EURO|nr:uncharacterized protein N7532_004011 [Penicillium argentinense]KAJ5103482.1 hypothetical protein N7532_004011 [Penicillium argentinense]
MPDIQRELVRQVPLICLVSMGDCNGRGDRACLPASTTWKAPVPPTVSKALQHAALLSPRATSNMLPVRRYPTPITLTDAEIRVHLETTIQRKHAHLEKPQPEAPADPDTATESDLHHSDGYKPLPRSVYPIKMRPLKVIEPHPKDRADGETFLDPFWEKHPLPRIPKEISTGPVSLFPTTTVVGYQEGDRYEPLPDASTSEGMTTAQWMEALRARRRALNANPCSDRVTGTAKDIHNCQASKENKNKPDPQRENRCDSPNTVTLPDRSLGAIPDMSIDSVPLRDLALASTMSYEATTVSPSVATNPDRIQDVGPTFQPDSVFDAQDTGPSAD